MQNIAINVIINSIISMSFLSLLFLIILCIPLHVAKVL